MVEKFLPDYKSVPNGDVKKLYAVGCYTSADWEYIHDILLQDGTLEDNIPSETIKCADLKEHSDTRAVYFLTDSEAEQLKEHPRVKFVNIDYSSYKADFSPPPDELKCTFRYKSPTKQYRNWADTPALLATTSTNLTSADINRSGYQLIRCSQKTNPWKPQSGIGITDRTIVSNRVQYLGTGKDVDVIVGDEGCWFGHSEFQNNTGNGPMYYVGGNKLPGNGICDVLDLVLDSPYYIDPDWFNADSANRLTTRWDGTIVPIEQSAKDWWGNISLRSSQFFTLGVVNIVSGYTRASCNGSNIAIASNGSTHGTQCSALTFGRTQGWAFNANKWFINAYGTNGVGIEQYFDIMKIFHLSKSNNPQYGKKDPTITSNSWGYRAVPSSSGYYYYRVGTSGASGISYTSSTKPGFMSYVGVYGDANRMKGETLDNSTTVAGEELINAGVIFVCAAGNSNQKQVGPSHPDYNNYWSISANTPLSSATHNEFGFTTYNTTNRRGFPQQLGKYSENGTVIYPAINIGALDDSYQGGTLERKVNYSDMGEEIDCYAPADGTLAGVNTTSGYIRPDKYTYTYNLSTLDGGITGICTESLTISGTNKFSSTPLKSFKITTTSTVGTATTIINNLLGSASLTASTIPTVGGTDDGYWTLTLPFNISFGGISYSQIYVGTNSYITFGQGSTLYSSLSYSNPPYPKIMISSVDNSCQRIYYGTEGSSPNQTYRVRFEGTNRTSGTLGSPNMVWEAVFYESSPSEFDIHTGVNARVSTPAQITNFYDAKFSGTSAACPVATGLIATKLQYNRDWTWKDIRSWLKNKVEIQSSDFYSGVESTTANAASWSDVNSLEGGQPRVIYDALTGFEDPLRVGATTNNSNSTGTNRIDITGSLEIKYK